MDAKPCREAAAALFLRPWDGDPMANRSGNMALDIAREANAYYASRADEVDQVMIDHQDAMDCRNCESFLKLGMHAFEWLMSADSGHRMAMCEDIANYNPEFDRLIREGVRNWLTTSEHAVRWIGVQEKRGFAVDNLVEFRRTVEEARAIVESFADDDRGRKVMGANLIALRDQALAEPYDPAAEIFSG